jgi:PRTRC genetic system ThiF family protein
MLPLLLVLESGVLYWLDLGNNASSGQFVLGQPKNSANKKNKDRLPTVAELYPEILKSQRKEDDQPSCSAAEALTRQEPFINQNLAYQALGMLTQLLRHGAVSYQGGFCNLATGRVVPLAMRAINATIEPAASLRLHSQSSNSSSTVANSSSSM